VAGVGLLVASGAALAGKVRIEYDEHAKPGAYGTFRYVTSEDSSLAKTDPELHEAIVAGLVAMLEGAGLRQVSEDPDVEATYHVTTVRGINFDPRDLDYHYGDGWTGGLEESATSPLIYREGSLVVDVWDARTRELLWRGISTDVLTSKRGKQQKRLDGAFQAMEKRWEKVKRKRGR
jgi:hypothetical protein